MRWCAFKIDNAPGEIVDFCDFCLNAGKDVEIGTNI